MAAYAISRLGHTYDLKNMFDLARYLLPMPPLPRRWRRKMLTLGSGDPTKAICSSLIAQAFHSVGYPILPPFRRRSEGPTAEAHNREILYIKHSSVYTPRDFDLSPYFQVVKPVIEQGFNYRSETASQLAAPTTHGRARWNEEFEYVLQIKDEQIQFVL